VHALFEEELEHFLQGGDADHLGDHVPGSSTYSALWL
jgi:hypothetical protein